jgi:hypothetical protein
MTYDNVKLKTTDRGDGVKVQSIITPFLQPFIEKLALKYPQWTFEEDNTNYKWDNSTGKSIKTDLQALCFKVMDKREELGQVYTQSYHSSHGQQFCIDNFRVSQLRERGNGMKTIHEKKALKHVDKFFGKKNLDEKLKDATTQAQQCIYRVSSDLNQKFDWEWNRIEEVGKQFIMRNHFEEFVGYVNENAHPNSHNVNMAELPEKFERKMSARQVSDAFDKGKHYLVYVDGQNYAIFRKNEPTQIKVSEELPEFIRRSVGLLKLVEDNQIVSGIGCRVNATTYVVLQQI